MKRSARAGRAARAALLVSVALPVGVGCSGLLGIDAPSLLMPEGPDGGVADATGIETETGSHDAARDTSMTDSAVLDSARGGSDAAFDARPTTDGPERLDGSDGGFDGNCACTSDACAPVVLANEQAAPTHVAVDSNGVYWINTAGNVASTGSVMRADLDGTNRSVVAQDLYAPQDVAVGGGNLYWSSIASPGGLAGRTTAPPYTALALPMASAVAIAANDDTVAWVGMIAGKAALLEFDPSTDAGSTLVADPGAQALITIDGTSAFWVTSGTVSGIATCRLSGCTTATGFWTSNDQVGGLTNDGVNVYWTDGVSSAVYACPTGGCVHSPPSPLATLSESPTFVVSDGTHVYVATAVFAPPSGSIVRLDLDGGAPTVIVQGAQPAGLAVGSTCVYWTDSDGGYVYASPK